MIVTVSKMYFSIVLPQLDGEVFPTFVAKRQRIQKKKCFKIVQTNGLSVLQNALIRITRSSHSLSTTYRRLYSGTFMDELFKPCERL